MKIIIKESKKREVLKEFEPVTIVAGAALLIGALFAFFASKFFGSYERGFTRIGEKIDKDTNKIQKALENEKSIEAKEALQEINKTKQNLVDNLNNTKEEAKDVNKATEMKEEPSVTISRAVTEFTDTVQNITEKIAENISPETNKIIQQATADLQNQSEDVENIDLIQKLYSKVSEDGLWNKVIAGSPIEKQLSDDNEWDTFVKILAKFV